MAQNRKPPAYQEYPAAILANRPFRLMSLASRGLVWSMRLECWENQSVPSSAYQLARTLGYQHDDVKDALTTEVMSFFKEINGVFISPELEDYRLHLNQRKRAQEEGGRKGAAKTNGAKKSGSPQLPRQVDSESLVKSNPEKHIPEKQNKNLPSSSDYNNYDEYVNEYKKASDGE